MSYTYFDFGHKNCAKVKAFSLVEVMLALVIIAVVVIVGAPMVTKKPLVGKFRHEGVVYTYNGQNIDKNVTGKCYINHSGTTYKSTNMCSEYIFTVPSGVDKINLTLVAGGGGGGGASGGLWVKKDYIKAQPISETKLDELEIPYLKSFKINYMIGAGEKGRTLTNIPDQLNTIYLSDESDSNKIKIKTGEGGKSSYAIKDYILDRSLYDTELTNPINKNLKRIFNIIVAGENTNATAKNNTKLRIGRINTALSSSNADFVVYVDHSTLWFKKNGAEQLQYLPKSSIIEPQSGTPNNFYINTNTDKPYLSLPYRANLNYGHLDGEEGGKSPFYSKYGAGGRGQALLCQSQTPAAKSGVTFETSKLQSSLAYNNLPAANQSALDKYPLYCYSNSEDAEENGKSGFFSATSIVEYQGRPGGGGAGGTVLKIKDMPVSAGDTYVIRVGKGGKKGIAGRTTFGPTSIAASKGEGGTSSSIWKKTGNSETLVYLVAGAPGGNGGNPLCLKTSDEQVSCTELLDNNGVRKNLGVVSSGRYQPFVVLNSTSAEQDFKYVDSSTAFQDTNTCSVSGISGATIRCLKYPKIGYTTSNSTKVFENPYQYLSYYKNDTTPLLGGFSSLIYTETKPSINGVTYLTGFYGRNVINNKFGHAGGLGGFTGFGGKAGCGGLFFGNLDGFNGDTSSPSYNIAGSKKIFIPSSISGTTEQNYTAHNVVDYYDNCSTSSPNGHSADFKLPNPKTGDVGQAGAGGGGGGYLMFEGAGNGGDGQDGYVMIDWRK